MKVRTSTNFSQAVGYLVLGLMIGVVFTGLLKGYINESNIMELINSLLIFVATFFGINQGRIAVENSTSIKNNGALPGTPTPGAPVDPTAVTTSVVTEVKNA